MNFLGRKNTFLLSSIIGKKYILAESYNINYSKKKKKKKAHRLPKVLMEPTGKPNVTSHKYQDELQKVA